MFFKETTLQDWEALVAKQLKTDDIYSVLNKENIEELEIKPYYSIENCKPLTLARNEENIHLVAPFHEIYADEAFAFLIEERPLKLKDKVYFYQNPKLRDLAEDQENRYMCLWDAFSDLEQNGEWDTAVISNLLKGSSERKLGVDIALYQNAGASMVQQLAIALLKAKELVEQEGVAVLDTLVFRNAIGSQYFLEIAKIRALKVLMNQLAKEYGKSNVPYIFSETSMRNKSIQDPENNLIRSTLELASAMVAGSDAVFSNNYKLENPNSVSEEISFKQQVILAYESIIDVFEDAFSGSYFVENATRELAEKAWQLFVELENQGGYIQLLKEGEIQKIVYQHAVKEQTWLDEGKIKLIGVNLYPKLEIQKEISDLYDEKTLKKVRLAERYGA